jgi:hypothetical protein
MKSVMDHPDVKDVSVFLLSTKERTVYISVSFPTSRKTTEHDETVDVRDPCRRRRRPRLAQMVFQRCL